MKNVEKKILDYLIDKMKLPDYRYKTPFVIAFSGYPGAGKSTLAQIFSNKLSCYIIGGDKIRNMVYDDESLSHEFSYVQEITNYVYEEELRYLLKNNVSVIIDRSVSSFADLSSLKKIANNIILINLISNDDENLKRISNRNTFLTTSYKAYGDVYSISGINTKELYNEVKKRKIYDLDEEVFDFQINTLQPFDNVVSDVNEVIQQINRKYW